jgi:hypothetical protein
LRSLSWRVRITSVKHRWHKHIDYTSMARRGVISQHYNVMKYSISTLHYNFIEISAKK